ncbi:MAG: ATP-binding protein [Desulfuromonadales bacterium]|nr:ATP-binding protein [Desulfuromonadales bacterium]
MNSLSIKAKISLAVAVGFVVFATGVTYVAFRYFEEAYRKSVIHDLTLMSATLADNIDSRLILAENALGAAKAAFPPTASANPALAQKFIDERVTLRNLFPNAVLVISPEGRLIAANGSGQIKAEQDFSRRDFFVAAVSQKAPYLSTITEQPEGNAKIIVALPVLGPHGEISAVMAGINDLTFSTLSIENLIREKIGPEAHVYIASRDGAYLLHHGEEHHGGKIPAEQMALFERTLTEAEATGDTVDCCGERILASFHKLRKINSILMISSPLSLVNAPLDKAKEYFLAAIFFGTILFLFITWGMTARIIEPLHDMTRHVKTLPELPHDKRLLKMDRGDEIGVLSKAFDQLMVTLENREAELLKLNQKQRQRAIELAAINRELEAFSSSLSHDLKTPLTSICLAAEALRESVPEEGAANAAFCLSTILAEGERMNDLIDGMLLLSRASQAEMRCETVDLSTLAREILLRLCLAAPDREVEWEVAADVVATGDARLLAAAMDNLIGNAWKYTAAKAVAWIEFGVLQGDERVFFVRDNGVGFDLAKAGRLFEPFQRLHGEEQFKGFGIGLATVQRIIQRHGGRIWADAAPNQGATFYFTLQPGSSADEGQSSDC